MANEEAHRGTETGRVLVGVGIIAFGLVLLLDRLGYPYITIDARYWPFLLLAFGTLRLLYPERGRSRRSGAWLLSIGLWGLVSEFHVWGLDYSSSWPLLIIAAGLGTIWRAVEGPRPSCANRS